MKIPATGMDQHLMWTRSGVVWATWRVKALPTGSFGTFQAKQRTKLYHQALYQAMRGEGLHLGLCADLDPVTLVERMLEGIDVEECPDWKDEVLLTLDSLEQIPLGSRAFWICVPLAAGSLKTRAMATYRAADTKVRELGGLPRVTPSEAEVMAARQMAKEIEDRIPKVFEARRATPAENIWIALHNQQRGLRVDSAVPPPAPETEPENILSSDMTQYQLPTAMPNPWLDEGGQSDLGPAEKFWPFKRKYLKVQSPYADVPSYQVVQALVSTPKSGWLSPGVEWISAVDDLPIDVDWALRLTITPAADVRRRNKRAEDALKDQISQQEDSNTIIGGGSDLAEVAEALEAYHRSLNQSDKEVEAQVTVLFTVGADNPEDAMRRAQMVADSYKSYDFLLESPLGGQEELWWAGHPGIPTGRLVRELAQITTGRELATGTSFVSSELGDVRGARFGVNITNGRHGQIFRDIEGNNASDISGSFGVVAEKGAGKSVLLKDSFGQTIDRGGRCYGIDRTVDREYGRYALSLRPDRTIVANMLEFVEFEDEEKTVHKSEWSVDPLRVFGPRVGARMLQSLFAVMLGIDVLSDQGTFLSSILEGKYLAEKNITSTPQMLRHLQRDLSSTPEAVDLIRLMKVVESKDIGEVIFNDGLPAISTDATGIVFLTAGLTLPKKMELEQHHLFREIAIEKRFGRAIYAMLTQIIKFMCFRDKRILTGGFFDETHAITSSPEGASELSDFFRDDRKHNAFAGVGSHDPADFGDEEARGLIKTRYVMRQTDPNLARRALKWLAEEFENDPTMLQKVTKELSPIDPSTGKVPEHRRGEGIMLDAAGRMGLFRKTLPENPIRRAAILSTPTKVAA